MNKQETHPTGRGSLETWQVLLGGGWETVTQPRWAEEGVSHHRRGCSHVLSTALNIQYCRQDSHAASQTPEERREHSFPLQQLGPEPQTCCSLRLARPHPPHSCIRGPTTAWLWRPSSDPASSPGGLSLPTRPPGLSCVPSSPRFCEHCQVALSSSIHLSSPSAVSRDSVLSRIPHSSLGPSAVTRT